jgi:hypothetical protein
VKILVLHSGGNEAHAEEAAGIASSLSLPFILENISAISQTELLRKIKSVSHIIACVDPENTEAPWVYICTGFALGRGRPEYCCFYGQRAAEYGEEYPVCSGGEELQNYLEEEVSSEESNVAVIEARERIISAGYAYTEEGLVRSVEDGNREIVSMFLQAGFSVDSTNEKGVPLLNLAVRKGIGETGELLLDAGADIDVPAADNGNTPLIDAVAGSDEKTVRTLVEKNCRLDVKNKGGQTALILAVGLGDEKNVRILVEAGADKNISDALGMTATKYAELFKNKGISDLLR